MVTVVAICLLGAAQALWYEQLTAKTAVSSGTLDAELTCELELYESEQEGISGEAAGSHEYLITVIDASHGNQYRCELSVENTGNVAWRIETLDLRVFYEDEGGPQEYAVECPAPPNGDPCTAGGPWPDDGTNTEPLFVQIDDIRGCEVLAGDTQNAVLIVGVNEIAEPTTEHTLQLKFQVNQWNESDWDGCAQPAAYSPAPVTALAGWA